MGFWGFGAILYPPAQLMTGPGASLGDAHVRGWLRPACTDGSSFGWLLVLTIARLSGVLQ
jgi:hypothetical protein